MMSGGDREAEEVGSLVVQLKSCECQFTWGKRRNESQQFHQGIIRTNKGFIHPEGNPFAQGKYALSLAYRHGLCEEFDAAKYYLKMAENLIDVSDRGLAHVVNGCAAHIYFRMGSYDMARLSILAVTPFYSLTAEEQCSIILMKCYSMEYLLYDEAACQEILLMYRQVMELDPWNRQVYTQFARLVVEIHVHNVATKYNLDDALLASSRYMELGGSHFAHGELLLSISDLCADEEKVSSLQQQANDLYRSLLSDKKRTNPRYLLKIGQAFADLKPPLQDLDLAWDCFVDALNLDPRNTYLHYKYAVFLYNNKNNLAGAVDHLEKNITAEHPYFVGHIFLVMLKIEFIKDFNVEMALLNLLLLYTDLQEQATVYCYLGDYYQIYNPKQALHYYNCARDLLPEFTTWGKNAKQFKFQLQRSGEVVAVYGKFSRPHRHDVVEAMEATTTYMQVQQAQAREMC